MTGCGLSSTSRRLTAQSWVLPVAPDAPVAGSKVSVMKPSTCGAKAATSASSSAGLPSRTIRLLTTCRRGTQRPEARNPALVDRAVQLHADAAQPVAQGGNGARLVEVGDQPGARTQAQRPDDGRGFVLRKILAVDLQPQGKAQPLDAAGRQHPRFRTVKDAGYLNDGIRH